MNTIHHHGSGAHETRLGLTLQEAIARDVILERTAARHHAPRQVRRHVHAALVLRRLAERLDPVPSERIAPTTSSWREGPVASRAHA